uniref:acetate--CoA ligase n=1 Tax=Candidatus Kentrum sp. SD TaxID=2126332 RepID=A0A450Y5L1_9GAMM|nr:MAG: acetyl-CoA synthetase [Candidatus Kentron sp. SD]VFK44879.1 MAG: acetyl-CoA synthetase [Candidatus Kentron sp. SD]
MGEWTRNPKRWILSPPCCQQSRGAIMKEKNPYAWEPTPSYIGNSVLKRFMDAHGIGAFEALLSRSDADPEWYWAAIIRHFGIRFYRPYERLLDTGQGAPWARWCVGGTTNVALNCLDAHRGTPVMEKTALVWEGEGGRVRAWDYARLMAETNRLAQGLRGLGLKKGDTIGIYMPIMPEAMAAFFAIIKIGAIVAPLFSGFGAEALVSRLSDAGCKALVTVDGAMRRGKAVIMKDIADEAAGRVSSLRHVVVLQSLDVPVAWHPGCDHWWHEATAGCSGEAPTEEMSAEDPFMIIFTSGTSGKAKGTVHTHCGFLTKLAADIGLCMDFQPEDRMLWMSDLGWLIGPMQFVAGSFFGATLVLAEGAPDYPQPGRLWRLVRDHRVTYLGIAPTIARLMMRYGVEEVEKYDLSSLRVTLSSGELWNPDSWTWFFEHVCKRRVPNLNVSGGTEIGWGIVTSTVIQPHKPCAFSSGVPGMGADVVDASGSSMPPGCMGELVLRHPSIGLSRGLWGDPERYLETYWNRIPGLWVHGDWASRDEDGAWYLHGRSDDTIMVAGKRCGPAEVESLLMETGRIAEAAATAITDPLKGEAILCVCVPKAGPSTDDGESQRARAELVEILRDAVTRALGPAFRPAEVVFVEELPKTRSMKVMRRVVRALYEGNDPGDLASMVNPHVMADLRRVFS